MKIFLLLYADYTVVLSDTSESLQSSVKRIQILLWALEKNVDKTKELIFEKRRNRTVRHFHLNHANEDEIEIVDSYFYLGTLFNQKDIS